MEFEPEEKGAEGALEGLFSCISNLNIENSVKTGILRLVLDVVNRLRKEVKEYYEQRNIDTNKMFQDIKVDFYKGLLKILKIIEEEDEKRDIFDEIQQKYLSFELELMGYVRDSDKELMKSYLNHINRIVAEMLKDRLN